MIPGILGKKIGMTQIFMEDGDRVSVTVLEAGPCTVQAVKLDKKDGYKAVQLGYDDTKESRIKKPQREYLKANKLKAKRFVREIRYEADPDLSVGDEVTTNILQIGDFLDITGVSKGKGFQGGMKRHNWSGGPKSHGSKSHRAPGSIGASSYPSRVFKGQNMPGQMGNAKVTIQNLEVVDIDAENNIVLVKGAVPGANGTYLIIKYATKKPLAERVQPEPEPEPEAREEDEVQAEAQEAPTEAPEEEKVEAAPEKEDAEEAAPQEDAKAPEAVEEAKSDVKEEEKEPEKDKG